MQMEFQPQRSQVSLETQISLYKFLYPNNEYMKQGNWNISKQVWPPKKVKYEVTLFSPPTPKTEIKKSIKEKKEKKKKKKDNSQCTESLQPAYTR